MPKGTLFRPVVGIIVLAQAFGCNKAASKGSEKTEEEAASGIAFPAVVVVPMPVSPTPDAQISQPAPASSEASTTTKESSVASARKPLAPALRDYVAQCAKGLGLGGPENFFQDIPTHEALAGWLEVESFDSSDKDLATASELSATLYKWVSGDVECSYLFRFKADFTMNGILCFNKSTGAACAFDYKGTTAPADFSVFVAPTRGQDIDTCGNCHIHGMIAPREKSYEVAEREGWLEFGKLLAKQGGPNWITDNPKEPFPSTGLKTCSVPETCATCHGPKWVSINKTDYASSVFNAAFEHFGSMRVLMDRGELDKVPYEPSTEAEDRSKCEEFLECAAGDMTYRFDICESKPEPVAPEPPLVTECEEEFAGQTICGRVCTTSRDGDPSYTRVWTRLNRCQDTKWAGWENEGATTMTEFFRCEYRDGLGYDCHSEWLIE